MFVVGGLLIAGVLGNSGLFAEQTLARTMFGVILILYGIYRVSITVSQKQRNEKAEREKSR
jgi:uncharacterized membrane protein YtjA (UPF0391 family)